MGAKEEFIAIYREYIKREGSKELLDYIMSTDFFTLSVLFFSICTSNSPNSPLYHIKTIIP